MRCGLVSLGIAARFALLFYIPEQFEGVLVVVGAEGHAVATMRLDAAPGAFQDPGAEQVLREFCNIVAVIFLPVVGQPLCGVNFHAGNITKAAT